MPTGPEGRPGSLRWLYGLLAGPLASLRVLIGKVWFSGPRARIIPLTIAREQCAARHPGDPGGLNACPATQARLQGTAIGTNAYVMFSAGYTVVTVFMSAVQEPLDEELLRRVAAGVEETLVHLR